MALSNLAISYSAAWQGSAVERLGYPLTLSLDAIAGIVCIGILPFLAPAPQADAGESAPAGVS